MKLPFTIYDLPSATRETRAGASARHRPSGMALVITLILLSVTLVMAIAFLAISRRERSSVTTQTDATTSRLAADAALSKAEAEIIANMMGNGTNNNPYNYGLLVSTNYINVNGFTNGSGNLLNVNYNFRADNQPYTTADFLQNVANLFYDPRPPVFIQTNANGSNDFRFYLDLNRNEVFDDSGMVTNVDKNGNGLNPSQIFAQGDPQWIGILTRPDAPHGPDNFFVSRYAFVAVPVGNTMDLNYIHNQALNRNLTANDGFFRNEDVGAWEINLAAFLADLNTNQWGQIVGSGLFAPAGSATWYQYEQPSGNNSGHAFEDSRALLSWRYANNYNSLASLQAVMGNGNGYNIYANGVLDLYDLGLWMTNTMLPLILLPPTGNTTPWLGSDNTNHFFDLTADLFDSTKSSPNFVTHLQNASTNVDTYDRYTFYRLLSQLGTDSQPEDKMNVNYVNITNGVVVANMETNMIPWTNSLTFFTNAADRLLRAYSAQWFKENPSNYLATYYGFVGYNYYYTNANGSVYTNDPSGLGVSHLTNYFGLPNVLGITNDGVLSFGVTNIPVLVSNKFVYASSVNRLLQLAANMYDATTNSFYPSVFRPIFERDNSDDIFIVAYTNVSTVTGTNDMQLASPYDIRDLLNLSFAYTPITDLNGYVNVYGVPWIIGAKKGFPNFNEFCMEDAFQITRKLQLKRSSAIPEISKTYQTNQMYILSLTNYIGVECWNSYQRGSNYVGITGNSGPVDIFIRNDNYMWFTNDNGYSRYLNVKDSALFYTNVWMTNRFIVPFSREAVLFTNAIFIFDEPSPPNYHSFNDGGSTTNFVDAGINPLPPFGVLITNRIQVAMIDFTAGPNGHVIDYVQLNQLEGSRNINNDIADVTTTGLWSTNLYGGTLPAGVVNQIITSRTGVIPDEDTDDGITWSKARVAGLPSGIATSKDAERLFFQAFFSSQNTATYYDAATQKTYTITNYQTSVEAPFTPTRMRVQRLTWQANDPLVHYLASDLVDTVDDTNNQHVVDWPANLGYLNNRYMPWGGNPAHPDADLNKYNLSLKDPRVFASDDWDFPTNKFPSIGWLGRIHRGTPWQTVYLKASDILAQYQTNGMVVTYVGLPTWTKWTGDADSFDAVNSAPGQDRILFDLFTAAPNDNATHGQLSVNVEAGNTNDPAAGLAAWSALFSGMVVPTSLTNTYDIISPAGVDTADSPLWQIVTNINYTRAHFTNTDGTVGVFEHVGDMFAVPKLTDQSPFLDWLDAQHDTFTGGSLNDELYEWLPQQAMSLLKVSSAPRYVVYCYGQTLKPSQNGLVTASTSLANGQSAFGICTNYVPVAETAIRVLVHVEDANTPHPHIVVDSYNVLPPD